MSKILKTIVNLVVLFSIVIAAALLVPPFAGIDTVMNEDVYKRQVLYMLMIRKQM